MGILRHLDRHRLRAAAPAVVLALALPLAVSAAVPAQAAAAPLLVGAAVGTAATGSAAPAASTASTDRGRSGPACTQRGTPRADRLVGTPRRDVLCGGGGADVLVGAGGRDVLLGGPGRDDVRGGRGDDTLTGGPAADDLDGGPGDDRCEADGSDQVISCVHDTSGPAVDDVRLSVTEVDVTLAARTVVVSLRVTDDTGVQSVAVRPGADTPWFPTTFADRVSGDAREGRYEARVVFPRYSRPGTYRPHVQAYDRLDRDTRREPAEQVQVLDATPDTERPRAELQSPDPDRVFDTRSDYSTVPVRVRLVDELSGVDPEQNTVGLWAPRVDGRPGSIYGGHLELLSGDRHDGVWGADITLRPRSKAGAWSVGVFAGDLAGRGSPTRAAYWGPGERPFQDEPRFEHHSFPADRGTVTVLGRDSSDRTPPTLAGAGATPTTIDTLRGPVQVNVTARALDVGRGVARVGVHLGSEDPQLDLSLDRGLELASGTAADGRWSGTLTVPRGTPPGRYHLSFYVEDRDDNAGRYVDSDDPRVDYEAVPLDLPTIVVTERSD